jgi:hypothetical protein
MVIRTMQLGLLTNIIVGFLATRWGNAFYLSIASEVFTSNPAYQNAVFGLLAGSIVIAVLTTRHVIKVLRDLDYYIYAAS